MKNLLDAEIESLQFEYLTILKNALNNFCDKNIEACLDEILVFWSKKKTRVIPIIQSYIKSEDTYLFTGASYLDIDDNEHYPFFSVGDKHIIDDPLCVFIEMYCNNTHLNSSTKICQQLYNMISYNINIIGSYFPKFLILPLRYIHKIDQDLSYKGAKDIFLSMFSNDINTFEDYKKLENISDIEKALCNGMDKTIFFDEEDDRALSLVERFKGYVNRIPEAQGLGNDNQIFLYTVMGHLVQALDIIKLCVYFNCAPYIRYDITFKYVAVIGKNFVSNDEICKLLNKGIIANTFYNRFEKQKVEAVDFNKYATLVNNYRRDNSLYNQIDINDKELLPKNIIPIIDEYFEKLCEYVSTNISTM